MANVTGDKLLEDLKQVLRDAEDLLKATAGHAGEGTADLRARAEDRMRANPWVTIGIGAAAGLLVGLLLGRRGGGSR